MADPPKQYFPVRTAEAGFSGRQSLHPCVDVNGVPIWEPGDTDIRRWEITSIGWCHGHPSNRKDETGLRGYVYLTGARVVATSDHFAHGSRYRAYGFGSQLVTAAIATKVSNMRAQHAAAGKVLVAQMRLPWLMRLAYGPPSESKGFRGELRLCGQHLTAFSDPEGVIVFLTLSDPREAVGFAEALLARVRADRLTWEKTTDAERTALEGAHVPAAAADPGSLPMVQFAGSYRVSPNSGYAGTVSSRSRPVAAAPSSAVAAAPTGAAPPVPPGSRVCVTASCDARGLVTVAGRCDVCGQTTQPTR